MNTSSFSDEICIWDLSRKKFLFSFVFILIYDPEISDTVVNHFFACVVNVAAAPANDA